MHKFIVTTFPPKSSNHPIVHTMICSSTHNITGCPVVFDTHHHACYDEKVGKLPHPSSFLHDVLETWYRRGIRPKFHISEQSPDKN